MKDLKYMPLFDAYGALLTEHQRDICELYYMCDLSLTEIAEQKGYPSRAYPKFSPRAPAFGGIRRKAASCRRCPRGRPAHFGDAHAHPARVEKLKAEHPDLSAKIDQIISLMQIEGEHIASVTVRGGDEAGERDNAGAEPGTK